MTPLAITPAQTRAIVVGIEQYSAGSSWKLNGPAADACKFADWLVRRDVPPGQVGLFLSPLDRAGLNVPEKVEEQTADQKSIEDALTERLKTAAEPFLIIYWGGHGVTDAQRDHKLFYADASAANKRCLDLMRLLTFLKSDYFPPATLAQVLVIVDACANLAEAQNWKNALSFTVFPDGKPLAKRDQFVLFGARPGETADNLDAERTGLLSRELRPLLEAVPAESWPPDMPGLKDQVVDRFVTLRRENKTRQTPSFFWSRDWVGNDEPLGSVRSAGVDPAPAGVVNLDAQVKADIVNALLECNSLKVAFVREQTLLQLRSSLYNHLGRSPYSNFLDGRAIFDSLLARYPGGVYELLYAMSTTDRYLPAFKNVLALLKRHLPDVDYW
jgi:hypothetical protein